MVHPAQPDLSTLRNFFLLQYAPDPATTRDATPLIAALHAVLPDARIVAAASSSSSLEILRATPGLEQVIATPSPLHALLAAAKALRKASPFGRENHAVLLTNGNESTRVSLAALLGGSPIRVGFTHAPELASAYLRYDPRISRIANNLRILEWLGHGPELLEQLQQNPALLEPTIPAL